MSKRSGACFLHPPCDVRYRWHGESGYNFYKRLPSNLVLKWHQPYSSTMSWLRSRITFSLLHSAIQCIRGSRSSCDMQPGYLTLQWPWLSQNSISNNFSPRTATYIKSFFFFTLLTLFSLEPPYLAALYLGTRHACTTNNIIVVELDIHTDFVRAQTEVS